MLNASIAGDATIRISAAWHARICRCSTGEAIRCANYRTTEDRVAPHLRRIRPVTDRLAKAYIYRAGARNSAPVHRYGSDNDARMAFGCVCFPSNLYFSDGLTVAKGGSRFGAGRPQTRGICEWSMPLDVRELARRGLLRPGERFAWHWIGPRGQRASIGAEVQVGAVIVACTVARAGGNSRYVECTVKIDQCAGGFGSRPMFRCPRCDARCAVIFCSTARFACHTCLKLGYQSEAENLLFRLLRKQRKLERRLSCSASAWDGSKPYGMHLSTFARLTVALAEAKNAKYRAIVADALQFLARCGVKLPSD